MTIKLNERSVAAIEVPASGSTKVFDTEIRGFGVRVWPSGARQFFLDYTSPVDGRERRHALGRFGSQDGEQSAASARIAARALREQITHGEDPVLTRSTVRAAPAVAELADRYKRDHLPKKAAKSQKEDRTILDRDILPFRPLKDGPELRWWKVADVRHPEMAALHASITKSGRPVRANRVLAVASKMFSLALVPVLGEREPWRDQAQGNPCKGVERNPEEGKERYFLTAEIAALADAIAARKATPAVNCVRLVLLTGCRPGEALAATWEQFDAEPGWWVKPSAHTKQRKTHRVPLSAAAAELIESVRKERKKSPRARLNPHVFPGQKPGEPIKQLRSIWDELTGAATVALWRKSPEPKIAKLVADLERGLKRSPTVAEVRALAAHQGLALPAHLTDARLYDGRHSFASIGAGGGLGLPIIGRLLGHTQARTTQRYAHLADDPMAEAAERIGSAISGAGKAGAEVVDITKRRRR